VKGDFAVDGGSSAMLCHQTRWHHHADEGSL